jgi:hypothetical protein
MNINFLNETLEEIEHLEDLNVDRQKVKKKLSLYSFNYAL